MDFRAIGRTNSDELKVRNGFKMLEYSEFRFFRKSEETAVKKSRQPVEWTVWQAVQALNEQTDLDAYERARNARDDTRFSRGTPRFDLQMKLNGTVETGLRQGRLRAVGRVRDPLASRAEIPTSAWVEYIFGSYADSYATRKSDHLDRIYDIRIAPQEDGVALVDKYVHGIEHTDLPPVHSRNRGGAPGNAHWEAVFDALLTPLIRPAEFENQQQLIKAIEETFQRLGYEPPTQDGIRKRLKEKWPNLKALALRRD